MARPKKIETENTPEVSGVSRQKIAIIRKNCVISTPYGVGSHINHHQYFTAGQVIYDKERIDKLLKNNLPVEIYERVE